MFRVPQIYCVKLTLNHFWPTKIEFRMVRPSNNWAKQMHSPPVILKVLEKRGSLENKMKATPKGISWNWGQKDQRVYHSFGLKISTEISFLNKLLNMHLVTHTPLPWNQQIPERNYLPSWMSLITASGNARNPLVWFRPYKPAHQQSDCDFLILENKDLINKNLRPLPTREAINSERGWGIFEMLGK